VTHGKIIVGDILIVMLAVIAGGGFGWFLRAGLRTGLIETRTGSYNRVQQPGRYWIAVTGFSFALILCAAALIFAISDLFLGFRAS
jgi:hypothetical protein